MSWSEHFNKHICVICVSCSYMQQTLTKIWQLIFLATWVSCSLLWFMYTCETLDHIRLLLKTQSRIIGAVRGAHSQLWKTIIPVFYPYAPRKYDKRFGTPASVWFTRRNWTYTPNVWITGKKKLYMPNVKDIIPIEII